MLRFEYKYFFPAEQLDKLRAMLQPFMELDRYAKENGGEYTVRSIYFDTPDLACYYQKLAGVKRRNKVRLRGYNHEEDENRVFFEIKKKVDDPLYKNRASFSFEEAKAVLSGAPPDAFFSADGKDAEALNNARRFLYHIHARQMQPIVTVIYEREPYQAILKDRLNDVRLTFDKNLRGVAYPTLENLFDEKRAHLFNPEWYIMEVKFNLFLPSWTKAIVTTMGLKKGPASKYVICVDACREIKPGKQYRLPVIGDLASEKPKNGHSPADHPIVQGKTSKRKEPMTSCLKNFNR
jgi:hypothetical protein